MEHGCKIKWMALGYLLGRMVESTKDNIKRIGKAGREFFHGRMGEHIMGNGTKGNKMELAYLVNYTSNQRKVYGRMGRELGGCKMIIKRI